MLAPDIGMGEHAKDQISSPLLSLGLELGCIQNRKLLREQKSYFVRTRNSCSHTCSNKGEPPIDFVGLINFLFHMVLVGWLWFCVTIRVKSLLLLLFVVTERDPLNEHSSDGCLYMRGSVCVCMDVFHPSFLSFGFVHPSHRPCPLS